MLESFNALDNNVSIVFNLLFANVIILLCFFFLFLVICNNNLFIPVPIVNIKVKEEPAIPTGIAILISVKLYLTYQMMPIK